MTAHFDWFLGGKTGNSILLNFSTVNYVTPVDNENCFVYFNNDKSPLMINCSISEFMSSWKVVSGAKD